MMAYCAMLQRDFERLVGCYEMADASPLGACALAGTTYPYHAEGNGRETSLFKMLWKQFGRSFRSRLTFSRFLFPSHPSA